VGLALDRTNFAVDNRDRAKGVYMVRYANSAEELKGDGLIGKLFHTRAKAAKQGKEYFVSVRATGDAKTQVAVVDANGQADNSTDAQRIITLLHTQLN
jgi:outer membrane protein assembly factor BamC